MEYVQGQSLLESNEYLTEWRDGLKKIVDEFHSEGLVHGDLRDVNLLIPESDKTKVIIIDFDWGGKAGEVRYPDVCLHPDLGFTGRRPLTITVDDDNRTLGRALDKHRHMRKA